ncbi:MAG: dihydrofolate reductase [Pirellulaceae bacterium]
MSPSNIPWTLVVAAANNGVIGRGDALPWRLSSDLRRFKAMTMGHCLLMGRKTYESIGKPLPGRQTIVLSRLRSRCDGIAPTSHTAKCTWPAEVTLVDNLAHVNAHVEAGRQVMVVGGAQIYSIALPYCDTIWLTRVCAEVDGDVFLPSIDWTQWRLQSHEAVPAGPRDEWPTEFQVWRRESS